MQQQSVRQNAQNVTPQYEDSGLFQNEIVQVDIALSPQVHMSVRQDMIVTGVTKSGVTFEVLFAGRRKAAAKWLLQHLAKLRYQGQTDAAAVTVRIEGAWRTTFAPDPSGWETRRRQLVAAVWTVTTPSGKRSFGERVAR